MQVCFKLFTPCGDRFMWCAGTFDTLEQAKAAAANYRKAVIKKVSSERVWSKGYAGSQVQA